MTHNASRITQATAPAAEVSLGRRRVSLFWLCLGLFLACANFASAADTFTWRADKNRVDADIRSWELSKLLERIAAATGWQVYVEPGASHTVSTKFKDLPASDALRLLLGDLNFALVPQTNSKPRLLVFSTSLLEATQLVGADSAAASVTIRRIPNELIVTLKPGAKIDELARLLGAKVIGRIDALNAYRLRFDDEAAADAARAQLAANPDVAAVDSNYYVDLPSAATPLLAGSSPTLQLKPRAPGDTGRIVVGLIDTSVQSLGGNLDSFLLPSIAIAGDAQPDANRPTHGTSMAETVLGSLQAATGGSTSVQILPVDVYGKNPATTTFEVGWGVYRAVNAGANLINLSLGGGDDSPFLHNIIQQARQQGVLLFAAAGNEPTTTLTYPAAYPEVIAVTAGDRKGNIAGYANRGSFVDVVAPGANVIYYQDQPYFVSGTSAATAYATGMAAGLADAKRKSLAETEATLRASLGVKPAASPEHP